MTLSIWGILYGNNDINTLKLVDIIIFQFYKISKIDIILFI